ncbi:MAG: tRNA (N6-threonylcarbamoyladenosine(37)-N6)-methyltransferase TrmO [Eubacterium sp.]|nr:tRNA (N6-threonylcarbamoyladenosine(37)-N6)-methyltransferase TrmO [Eubacterium sp.]
MPDNKNIKPIAYIHTDYPTKFGIPRQFGLVDNEARIIFEKEFSSPDCVRELDGYSHIWVIWGFSANEPAEWKATVRPPRLGGNRRVGVFASRSPFRPNGLGLSALKLERIDMEEGLGPVLIVSGADLMDGTPIYDIKPYMPASDAIPEAAGGYAGKAKDKHLNIHCEQDLLGRIPGEKRKALYDTLALDPRPPYQDDPDRVYGMRYHHFDIRFRVEGNDLTVVDICCVD